MRVRQSDLLGSLPPEWPEDLLPEIKALVERFGNKIVVVDDDPTGNQTVYDVPVLTEWSQASLAGALEEPGAIVYILTNSRSLPLCRAQAVNREIGANLKAASESIGRDFVLISRSDSTLRGHYPGETIALSEGTARRFDGVLVVPFFLEGGRVTVEDVHYVAEGEWLVPAAETDYARDAAFGYRSSNLRDWVSEKHRGRIEPRDVASLSLADLRLGGPETVAALLAQLGSGQVCVANAVSYRDVEVLVAGLLRAEAAGSRFVYRTAASFVRVRGGLPPRSLLTTADLAALLGRRNGGLIVAGSYVKKSTAQIESARSLPGVASVEVAVDKLLDPARRDVEIRRAARLADDCVAAGQDALVYTSRHLVTGPDEESSLRIGHDVSTGLVEIVNGLTQRPAWMIAKGGITSSNIAVKGLQVKRAEVLGQALPGVPVWCTGPESRWPELIFVVFPGNVGGPTAVADLVRRLRGEIYG